MKIHKNIYLTNYLKNMYEFYKVSPNMRKGFEYNVLSDGFAFEFNGWE